ncbi:hypothetical protein C4K03_2399 [Pseudomonas synxantha]|uniref:Ferritin-like domain-containing protein n=1 Tax=Pseudomonas synxantha TaxID=47883 RepID=A0A3G7U594_9PSED|nr:ferritin-like domain-containing protein [Pseudomonas synxantha]AZE54554.1 hypothetical protein C4K03_2399 [Pseudomonas synxantha]
MNEMPIFNVPRPSLEQRLSPAYLYSRTTLFDPFVSSTHERFWDPSDPRYIDFSTAFDLKSPLLPLNHFPELNQWPDQIPLQEQIDYVNLQAYRMLSGFYYGEQAALLVCLKEAEELADPCAVEYAINQAREESRHQHGFQRYIQARFGEPAPLSQPYRELILRLLDTDTTQRKFVGIQLVIEGLGLATLGYVARATTDPVLRRLVTLVMADEAQHHRTGRMLAKREFPLFSSAQAQEIAEEAWACFNTMQMLYLHAGPLQALCARLQLAHGPTGSLLAPGARNPYFEAIFRRNAATIEDCGVITQVMRPLYSNWLSVAPDDALEDCQDQQLAEQVTQDLRAYNAEQRQRHALAPSAGAGG